ncbi:hypothetical protein D9M73_147630 [compost metagenome]
MPLRLSNVATNARLRTVWYWNRSRGLRRMPAWRARLTTWMEMIESPPSSKKLSSRPTGRVPSTSCQICASLVCMASCGATNACCGAASGGGKALRSSLPLAVTGKASSGIR